MSTKEAALTRRSSRSPSCKAYGRVTDYDLITLGRCSMDLFSENIGAPFVEIESFSAHVGARQAHGDADVGFFQRRRIVDAIKRDRHRRFR